MELVRYYPLPLLRNSFEFIDSLKIRLSPRFFTYYPNHIINIKTKNYELKSATNLNELLSVFKLRYKNFLEEDSEKMNSFDVDTYDHLCDHLIIKCRATDEVVGTYRILCSRYSRSFYSENEFVLSDFLKESGTKLELGRVCIDKDHRNGSVIDLLWKGIGKYANLTKARFLFGCSSVNTTDVSKANNLYNSFNREGHLASDFDIYTTKKYTMNYSEINLGNTASSDFMTPSLLKSYFSAGAKVYGRPAVDYEFNCIDFMTILDLNNLSRLFKRRYFKENESLS